MDVLKDLTRFVQLVIKQKKNIKRNYYLIVIFIIIIL